jgi:ribbon-helix-helix CopG family protein
MGWIGAVSCPVRVRLRTRWARVVRGGAGAVRSSALGERAGAPRAAREGNYNVAKKVFPVHLEVRDRRIVDALAERDNVSRAEAIRRIIRSFKLDVISSGDPSLAPAATDGAAH